MTLTQLHDGLANSATIFVLVLAVWALALRVLSRGLGASWYGAAVVGESMIIVQGAIGALMYIQGLGAMLPRPFIHILYGIVAVITLPGGVFVSDRHRGRTPAHTDHGIDLLLSLGNPAPGGNRNAIRPAGSVALPSARIQPAPGRSLSQNVRPTGLFGKYMSFCSRSGRAGHEVKNLLVPDEEMLRSTEHDCLPTWRTNHKQRAAKISQTSADQRPAYRAGVHTCILRFDATRGFW